MNHDSHACQHCAIRLCLRCDVVYCPGCGREWGQGLRGYYYPGYYYPNVSYPYFTNVGTPAGTSSVTSCEHGSQGKETSTSP